MGIFSKKSGIVPVVEHLDVEAPRWLQVAIGEIGVHEIRGGENKRILEYHATTSLHASEDEIAWCSSFANWCMLKAGIKGTNSAAALSWKTWGMPLGAPRYGCVVVFDHGGGHGHVTFLIKDNGDSLTCIGGNQSDSVKYSTYSKAELCAYRWPKV